jgi:hypothetical protein
VLTSFADTLTSLSQQILADLDELLAKSKLSRRFERHGGHAVIVSAIPFKWDALPDDVLPVQRRVRKNFVKFCSYLELLLEDEPASVREMIGQHREIIDIAINQDDGASMDKPDEYRTRAHNSIRNLMALLQRFPKNTLPLLIPDTNVLIDNPHITKWRFDGIERFGVVLAPAVLAELDSLKRKKDVQAQARHAIRKVEEIAALGSLRDGVNVDGRMTVRWLDADATPEINGLDKAQVDDRIIGCVLAVMRREPFAPAAVISGDVNLRNKADFAGIGYLAPPSSS